MVSAGDAAKRATALLTRFGLGDKTEHNPAELSAGVKQRVAIARAVANNPPIMLADEPTGNLDRIAAEDLFKAFKEIHPEGTPIVIVNHDDRIRDEATRVLKLEAGKVVE